MIIKKLYNFIISSACKNIYTQTCSVYRSRYISYQINQQQLGNLVLTDSLYKCLLLMAVFSSMSTDTVYITCFSFVCSLCTVDKFRFTRGIVRMEAVHTETVRRHTSRNDDLGAPASERRRTSLRALQRLNHHRHLSQKLLFESKRSALCMKDPLHVLQALLGH